MQTVAHQQSPEVRAWTARILRREIALAATIPSDRTRRERVAALELELAREERGS